MDIILITFIAMFSVMNPLGTVPVFVSLTKEYSKKEKLSIALKTSLFVLIILLVSFFIGKYLLLFFGISIHSLKIAGGLIISLSGFALLTGKFSEHKGMKKEKIQVDIKTRDEISLTPLALPMIAGPGVISLLISYRQEYSSMNDILLVLIALFLAVIAVFLILASSHYIAKTLGASGINAVSRIIGFIVIALGIEFIMSSVIHFVQLYS